jgi:hypothetical protein
MMQNHWPVNPHDITILRGMDTTGTQKAIDELAFENVGISVDGINFQRDKEIDPSFSPPARGNIYTSRQRTANVRRRR